MKRRHVLSLCGASISAFTGCLDNSPDTGGDDQPHPSNETTTTTPSRETTTSSSGDSEKDASPHEFVHLEPVEDESKITTASANETIAFRNLSAHRRETFRAALDEEMVAADGWSHYNESRPVYVRYNDTWFRVIVGVH